MPLFTSSPLRVLLLSPRAQSGSKGFSGEDAYTESLLASPPPGVAYTHYEDLIAGGKAHRLRWAQRYIGRAARWAGGPIWLESFATDERFDLVHLHAFSARLGGGIVRARTPVLLSESGLDLNDLHDYRGWGQERIARFARRKRTALRLIGAYDQTLNRRDARGLVVWSERARRLHHAQDVPDDFMRVVAPYVSQISQVSHINQTLPVTANSGGTIPHYLFVGTDFARKNGAMVVAAFREIQPSLKPGARLTVVGEAEQPITGEGIVHYPHLPRERILSESYPQANIFVLPSRAEGYGVAVIEAMSAGIAPIVSTAGVLPEIVGDAGIAVDVAAEGSMTRLADAMRRLETDEALREEMGKRARERYETVWSHAVTAPALADAYHRAVAGGRFAP